MKRSKIMRSAGIVRPVLLVALAAVVAVWTNPGAPSADAAGAVEILGATVNFGQVTQHQTLVHDFWIKSVGDQPIKITLIWPGCGCTQIPLEDSTIAPGDSMPLRIIFNTSSFIGLTEKRPTVKTDVTGRTPLKLVILADVLVDGDSAWPVVVQPDLLDVSQYGTKERRRGSFHLVNRSNEDLAVTAMDTTLLAFQVNVPELLKAGETIEGRVRVREDKVLNDFDESVIFRLEGKQTYYVTLPVLRRYRP